MLPLMCWMLVWMPLELFALLLNDGLALGPDDGQD